MWPFSPQLARHNPRIVPTQRLRSTRLVAYALARQRPELNIVKRERWTEGDLNVLPAEEPDIFERKSGELFADQGKFLDTVGKALSAFANSGGGSLILGVKDDGTPDGLPALIGGRTAIRDWVEQKIPHLLDYTLEDFRVHTVIKSVPSRIPNGREVIVIDVGDSAVAPHQSKHDKIYYRRQGGRSERAPHFYLELLRQRQTNPVLEFTLKKIDPVNACEHDNGLFLLVQWKAEVRNVGRVAAYNWRLNVRSLSCANENIDGARVADYRFADFPVKRQGAPTIRIDDRTILPGCSFIEAQDFGCQLRPKDHRIEAVREEIEAMLAATTFNYQLATETSPGELVRTPLSLVLDVDVLVAAAREKCPEFFHI
jgi:Putative DNA-binding domain